MNEASAYPCPYCGFDPAATPQPDHALPFNTLLNGKYLVGRVLGQGGFGITYLGYDLSLGLPVAIKEFFPNGHVFRSSEDRSTTIRWGKMESTQAIRRNGLESIQKEARKMAKIRSIPEVVTVHETFRENETAYLVMDYVEGKTLKEILKREGPMPWEKVSAIYLPVISAMEKVHKAGMVHRDISPDNLMLTKQGQVRILDLGAAKDLHQSNGASSQMVVKAGFSPLEQYGATGASGPYTDVYAMAASIYYTLTGILPPAAADRMVNDTLDFGHPALRVMPQSAREALQKALAVLAPNRTQTMAELKKGLETAPAKEKKRLLPVREKKKPEAPAPAVKKPAAPAPVIKPAEPGPVKQAPPAVKPEPAGKKAGPLPEKKPAAPAPAVKPAEPKPVKQAAPAVKPAAPKPAEKKPEPGKTADKAPKKKGKLPLIALCAVILIGAAFGFILTRHHHVWVPADCTRPRTCMNCDKTEGEPLGHKWEAATCTSPQTCTVCGQTEGEPLDHVWTGGTCTTAAVCSTCGEAGEISGHVWTGASLTASAVCSICGETGEKQAAVIGETVYFGSYEQDNDLTNGKEPIEWLVLAKENGKALLISQYGLDCQPYNSTYKDVTWETCSLRTWLNGTFLKEAFSADEQAMVALTNVSEGITWGTNPGRADPGRPTNDKVFLLSETEANGYFVHEYASLMCAPTAYAEAQGANFDSGYKTASGEYACRWWLRSPGSGQRLAACVNYSYADTIGYAVNLSNRAVRPALWINLGS